MSRIDDRQIEDGNIGPPDLSHFNWEVIQFTSGTNYPTKISGTKISGDMDLYWVQEIYRDEQTYLPYRVVDSLYRNSDNLLRWRKDEYLIRDNGIIVRTSGTITGENGD